MTASRQSRPVPPRPVQALLFRHCLLLAAVLGAATLEYPFLALLAPLSALVDSRCRDKQRRGARLAVLTLCFLLGLGWAWFRQPVVPPEFAHVVSPDAPVPDSAPLRGIITGRVVNVEGLYDRRLRVTLDDVRVRRNGENCTLPGQTTWSLEGFQEQVPHGPRRSRPLPGQLVRFSGKVTPISGFRNDGEDGGQRWWTRQNIFWRVWSGAETEVSVSGTPGLPAELRERLRQGLMTRLQGLYPDPQKPVPYGVANPSAPRGSGFIPALLFGDRFYLGVDDWDNLAHAGLLHSIALSGQHLAVTGLLAGLLLWVTGWTRPGVFLHRPRLTLGLWLALPLALTYLWLGNAPDSLVRSALMLGCLAVLTSLRRPATLMDGLLLALGLMTVANPGIVADVGAQLSFAAVFGLVLVAPLLQRWRLRTVGHPWLHGVGALLLCSGIIQLSTLPVTLETFGWISSWSWLNLLWLPVLGIWVLPLCVLALLAVALGHGPLADAALVLAVEPCNLLVEGLRRLGDSLTPLWCLRPHWTASAGLTLLLVGAALLWERRTRPSAAKVLCGVGFLLVLTGPLLRLADGLTPELRLRLLDVGQGQAALLEFPGERRILVDGGGVRSPRFDTGRDLIAPVLTRNRPPRVEALILSHPDMDHLRGLLFLAENFSVGEVVLPVGVSGHDTARSLFAEYLQIIAAEGIPVREVRAGAVLDVGRNGAEGARLEVLGPLPGRALANNDGLILRLTYAYAGADGDFTDLTGLTGLAVLPGDATRSLLGALVREGLPVQAQILVAPHHGSRHNMRTDFLRAVEAREIWASCAAFNRYDFPADELREFCAEQTIRLRQTAEEGELAVSWNLHDLKALYARTAE